MAAAQVVPPTEPKEPSEVEKLQQKLAEARKRKEARETAQQLKDDAKELLILDLEEKFSAEYGERGKDFEIIDTIEGVIAIKRVDAIVVKQWDDGVAKLKPGASISDDMMLRFTMPAIIYPDAQTYRKWVIGDERRPGATGVCADVCTTLRGIHGSKIAAFNSKR